MRSDIGDAHRFKKFIRFFVGLLRGDALIKVSWHNDVFKQRHIADKVHFLKDKAEISAAKQRQVFFAHLNEVFVLVYDLARGSPVHSAECVKKCRFARARCAHDYREVALVNIKVYPCENVVLHAVCGKGFAKLSCTDYSFFHSVVPFLLFYGLIVISV